MAVVIVGGDAYDVDKHLHSTLYPLFPTYCLGRGFIVLSTRAAFQDLPFKRFQRHQPGLYEWGQLGAPLTFLICETCASFVLTLLIQALSSKI